MEFLVRAAESKGEVFTLYAVAEGMARRSAEAGGLGFHQLTFNGVLPRYLDTLIAAAVSGQLRVCNQFGRQGRPDEILEEARRRSELVRVQGNESTTLALNVWLRLHHLNAWAQEQGDVFRLEWTRWVDGRVDVNPSEPEQSSEQPLPSSDQGAEIALSGPVSVCPGLDPATANWKMRIQVEAASRMKRLRASGASPTTHSILDDMATWCRANDVKTDNGIYPSSGYLRTHVLGGKHWKPPQ